MKLGVRGAAVAAVVAVVSYCAVAVSHQFAAAEERGAGGTSGAATSTSASLTRGTRTDLPLNTVWDVMVDDAHRQVFVSSSLSGAVAVVDFAGEVTQRIEGLVRPREMTISDDGSAVYVVEAGESYIAKIDTRTYELTRVPLPDGDCAFSVAFTGGKVWYSYGACPNGYGGVGVLDPATGTTTPKVLGVRYGMLRALSDRPERLALVSGVGELSVFDLTADPPRAVAERDGSGRSTCKDATLAAAGQMLVTTCNTPAESELFDTSDLSKLPSVLPAGRLSNAAAASADGNFVATAVSQEDGFDVYVTDIRDLNSPVVVRQYDFGAESGVAANTLAFSATGRLFVVVDGYLRGLADATKRAAKLTLTGPDVVPYQGAIEVSGRLDYAPGEPSEATLTRADRDGTHDLGAVSVAADGTFAFTDAPGVTGPVSYTVWHEGNADYAAAGAKVTVIVRPLPYDVNADGHAETIVGVPGEDITSYRDNRDAGMFHVLFGDAAGASGAGSEHFSQESSGVPGIAESGDRFGYANASGDFNGDGYADVAVSAPWENIGGLVDAGAVWVFYGSPSGLRSTQTVSLQDTHRSGSERAYFGKSLAAGDFNGDGRDDLAVGAPGVDEVFIVNGTDDGVSGTSLYHLNKATEGVSGGFRDGQDRFGHSLAAGDVNGDGRDELAVGAVYDREDRGYSSGAVTVFYADPASGVLTGAGSQRWSKDSPGVPGRPRPYDHSKKDGPDMFGHQVALADFNGDGRADLAAAAPGAPVWVNGVRKRDAGTLTMLYAASDGSITAAGVQNVSQQTPGMPGTAGYEDRLGNTLAAGDSNGDGKADLAAYSPADTYVTVIRGGSSGLAFSTGKGWTQNSAGIPGKTEAGDDWGSSLRFADITGAGHHALIVGADGENSGKGAITVIYATSTGLTGTGAKYLSQTSDGVGGTAEKGDGFGTLR